MYYYVGQARLHIQCSNRASGNILLPCTNIGNVIIVSNFFKKQVQILYRPSALLGICLNLKDFDISLAVLAGLAGQAGLGWSGWSG